MTATILEVRVAGLEQSFQALGNKKKVLGGMANCRGCHFTRAHPNPSNPQRALVKWPGKLKSAFFRAVLYVMFELTI